MQRPLRKFRVSETAKDQLIRLKRYSGIDQWNVLCRWAFVRSLMEETPPSPAPLPAMSNVELAWEVFAGPWGDVLWLMLRERVHADGLPETDESYVEQFRLHLHRGIAYLASDRIRSIEDLMTLGRQLAKG